MPNTIPVKKSYSARSMCRAWYEAFNFYRVNFWQLAIFCIIAVGLLAIPHFVLPALNRYQIDDTIQLLSQHLSAFLAYSLLSLYAANLLLKRTDYLMTRTPTTTILSWAETSAAVIQRTPAILLGAIVIGFFTTLGYVVLFIGSGLVATLFSLYFPLLYNRNLSAVDAFKQSTKLISPHFFWVFCTLLIPTLIFTALSTLVFIFARQLPMAHLHGQEVWVGHHLLRIIISALYFPYLTILLFIILNNLLQSTK